ncbi:hypothetical protein BST61_g10979 [Cercospora zeina]
MRLLHVEELRFEEFSDHQVPPYTIASHRWGAEEATLQDIQQGRATSKLGYRKIQGFARYAQENLRSIDWIWIDTCCIDKTSAAELSESVNLMFRWYRNAEICLAYLADVESVNGHRACLRSEWFRRGWTLQELLAPRVVVFLANDWRVIGNKGASLHKSILSLSGPGLEAIIAAATSLPEDVLHDFDKSKRIPQSEKLKWIEGRDATRKEDLSYALYGILDAHLGANYGEGFGGARDRLIAALHEREDRKGCQADKFRTIKTWLDPPDPWMNHETARIGRAADTGDWLLQSPIYRNWRDGTTRLLWLYGKAGCGKTILCSTAIEDIRAYCNDTDDVGYAVFYCSFSDSRKQSTRDILLSIVAQVCWKEPGLAMLQNVFDTHNRKTPSAEEVEKILLTTLRVYRICYLMVDALDECPEDNDNRRGVLELLARLLHNASNIRILAASRDESNIRSSMQASEAVQLTIDTHVVDADIRKYISAEISRDSGLSRLSSQVKAQIEDTLTNRADGMFRWTFCQLQEVKKLKSTKPSSITQALSALPATLDATYERILTAIEENVHGDALALLRWITYAQKPLTLEELVETTIIDLDQEASVAIDDRGGLGDVLEILSGLILTEDAVATWEDYLYYSTEEDDHAVVDTIPISKEYSPNNKESASGSDTFSQKTRVRLAHFSVKKYLVSTRILQGDAHTFQLQSAREHWILAQSCLAYLLFYSRNAHKTSDRHYLGTFPLLRYAAKTWYLHLSLQSTNFVGREAILLMQGDVKHDWWLLHQPEDPSNFPFGLDIMHPEASALYYASLLGLQPVTQTLLDAGMEVDDSTGNDNALIAASIGGHVTIAEILLKAGANPDAEGLRASTEPLNALYEATTGGHEKVVQILLKAGASVKAAEASIETERCDLIEEAYKAGHRGIESQGGI